jgi:hypothetical protein
MSDKTWLVQVIREAACGDARHLLHYLLTDDSLVDWRIDHQEGVRVIVQEGSRRATHSLGGEEWDALSR